MFKRLPYLITFLLIVCYSAGALAIDKNLLWKISNGSHSAYLLGSIHLGSEDLYPLPQVINDAYAAADVLAVEVNILALDAAVVGRLMMLKGMYSSTRNNLKNHIRSRTWKKLKQVALSLGMPIEFLQQQKPWLAGITLASLAFKQAGYREDLGIDYYFVRQAQQQKPIVELESLEQQMSIFDKLSGADQEFLLAQTLRDLEQGPDYLKTFVEAWKNADTATLNRLIIASFKSPDGDTNHLYRVLLSDRNIAMAENISALMMRGKLPFVVIGAGHLIGRDSILDWFGARGYRITQL